MEDSFQARVDKIFGSLVTTVTDTSASKWSLTDEEIERRKWNRPSEINQQQEEDEEEFKPPFNNFKKPDLKEEKEDEIDDDEDEEIDGKKRKRGRSGGVKAVADEDFDVLSNIGRDCTLDFEEEEDEYDKVAVGMGRNNGDRVYMREVEQTDYQGDELDASDELLNSFPKLTKDPRADPLAAKTRLEEDVGTSGTIDTSLLSDNSVATVTVKRKELDSENPKPILKKGKNLMDSTSQKRVRFTCNLKNSSQNELGFLQEHVSNLSENSPGLPDYLRNPSKYTRYTFDSLAEMDDQANKEAYMDIIRLQKKGITENSSEGDMSNPPRSVTFTPRMKPEYESTVKSKEREHRPGDGMNSKGWSVSVTAENSQENEVSDMEEDEPSLAADKVGFQKPSRKYRARNSENV